MFSFFNPWHLMRQIYEHFEWPFKIGQSIGVRQGPNYIVLSRENGICKNKKWDHLIEELFVTAMANRNGCLFLNEEDRSAVQKLNWNKSIHRKGSGKTTKYIYYKDCWTREDLHLIAHSAHFSLNMVRLVPGCDCLKALKMPIADIDKLWMFKPSAELVIPNLGSLSDMDILGGLADGEYVFWFNPSTQKIKPALEDVKLIASNIGVSFDTHTVSPNA